MVLQMQKYLIMSQKGGVGKSLVSLNLAFQLSKKYKVGFIEADTDSPWLGEHIKVDKNIVMRVSKEKKYQPIKFMDNIYVVSLFFYYTRGTYAYSLAHEFKQQLLFDAVKNTVWGDIDILLIDLPGGTEEFKIMYSVFNKEIDGVIGVVQPSTLRGLIRLIELCNVYQIHVLGIIQNMAGSHTECNTHAVCVNCGKVFEPFGSESVDKNRIKHICKAKGVVYLGNILLSSVITSQLMNNSYILPDELSGAIKNAYSAIERRMVE